MTVTFGPERSYTWQNKRRKENRKPWETPSVAGALSIFDPQVHHNFGEVLAEADHKMYQKKQEMKM